MNIKINLPDKFFEEEERALRVSSQTKRVWSVLLDLLCEFDRVCRDNGIRYFIDGGTLLGAVRHGGFIPWDDDADVIMLRSEYEKLNRVASQAFKYPYFWQTIDTDPDHGRGFARLRNSDTICLLKSETRDGHPFFRHNQGAFIDVFIWDNVPDDESQRRRFLRSMTVVHDKAWGIRMRRMRRFTIGLLFKQYEFLLKARDFLVEHVLKKDWSLVLLKRFCVDCQRYNSSETKFVSHITYVPDPDDRLCLMVPRDIFKETTEVLFEGHRFPAPGRYEEYLRLIYGDWRKHVIGAPSGLKFDTEHSYRELFKEGALND